MVNLSNISFVNIIVLLYYYPFLIMNKKSITATIVLLNGLIFHTNRRNNTLFYYDFICNIIMILYKNYYNSNIRLLSAVGSVVGGSNIILYRKYNYNRHIADIIHVISTTYIGYLCLDKTD